MRPCARMVTLGLVMSPSSMLRDALELFLSGRTVKLESSLSPEKVRAKLEAELAREPELFMPARWRGSVSADAFDLTADGRMGLRLIGSIQRSEDGSRVELSTSLGPFMKPFGAFFLFMWMAFGLWAITMTPIGGLIVLFGLFMLPVQLVIFDLVARRAEQRLRELLALTEITGGGPYRGAKVRVAVEEAPDVVERPAQRRDTWDESEL